MAQEQPGGQKSGQSRLPATKLCSSGRPVTNVPHIPMESEDEDDSDDEDTAITCTVNSTPSEELLSPNGRTAKEMIGEVQGLW